MLRKNETEERVAAWKFWQRQLANLGVKKVVSDKALQILCFLTRPGNIGCDDGQIRPGSQGQRDVYEALLGCRKVSVAERLLLSGLPAADTALLERRWQLVTAGVNPDDSEEVAEHERVKQMSKREIKWELAHLKPFK